ncbi:MAG: hypothetical protein HN416_14930 [Nitrospina sp.]|jgi:hypothetical protein|nr:hypothetical protein [Nitrospina sp.]
MEYKNFMQDLKLKLPELELKIKRLQWRFNISVGWQLDEAVDELAEKFLELTGHPNFEPGDAPEVVAHLYGIQDITNVWTPLEGLLIHSR